MPFVAHMSDINLRLCQLLSMTVELIIADMGFIKMSLLHRAWCLFINLSQAGPTAWLKRVKT